MADQIHGRIRYQLIQQRIQIGQVVRKPIALEGTLGAPEATQVDGDAGALLRQAVDQELIGFTTVTPAMQQHQRLRVAAGPAIQVEGEATRVESFGDGGTKGSIGH